MGNTVMFMSGTRYDFTVFMSSNQSLTLLLDPVSVYHHGKYTCRVTTPYNVQEETVNVIVPSKFQWLHADSSTLLSNYSLHVNCLSNYQVSIHKNSRSLYSCLVVDCLQWHSQVTDNAQHCTRLFFFVCLFFWLGGAGWCWGHAPLVNFLHLRGRLFLSLCLKCRRS